MANPDHQDSKNLDRHLKSLSEELNRQAELSSSSDVFLKQVKENVARNNKKSGTGRLKTW